MAMTAIAQALAPGFEGGFPFKVLGRISGSTAGSKIDGHDGR